VCVKESPTLAWEFFFNTMTSDFYSGDVAVEGGYCAESNFIDDPIPISGRGVWLNGDIDHFTVRRLSLNHSFTLELFIRPKEYVWETGTLFAAYRSPF
jgi:hypothetical protein